MGTTERRQREAEQRRRSILEAARRLFWRQGYAGATMPGIAAEAELAPGTLYLYFQGKDALYVELLIEGYELLLERLKEQAGVDAPPAEQGGRLVEAFIQFARDYPEYFGIIFFLIQRETSGFEGN
ncbi:MAG TPA: helix-turn-helix domain-containing protein, partial [Phycisphaerae bacterium]|nr:helix-turn-helix domain-containing protein [Phycisphaerae bacterium]